MSSTDNLLAAIARELMLLADPAVKASGSPAALYQLLGRMGWSLDGLTAEATARVESAATTVISKFEALMATKPDDLRQMIALLEDFREAFKSLDDVRKALTDAAIPDISAAVAAELLTDLLHYLAILYLARRSRALLEAFVLLTLVEQQQAEPLHAQGTTGPLVRFPHERAVLRLDNLPPLVSDPVGHLKTAYIPIGGVATDQAAEEVANRLFRRMRNLIAAFGGTAFSGLDGGAPTEIGLPENAPLRRSFTVSFGGQESTDRDTLEIVARGLLAITAEIVPANAEGAPGRSGPGLKVTPFGVGSLTVPVGNWAITVTAGSNPGAVFVSSEGTALVGDGAGLDLKMTARLMRPENAGPFVFGGGSSTRLEIGQLGASIDLDLADASHEYGFLIETANVAMVVQGGDGDGFLQKVLPNDGLRTDFDLAVGWSNKKGLYFRGSAGLEATLPVHTTLFDVLTIHSVHLGIRAKDSEIHTAIAMSATVNLGPVTAGVDRIGLKADFSFPKDGGNLGPAHVVLGFKPPDGAGLTIDAGAVVGGGYLFFDNVNQQYAGVLQLEIQGGIALKAIGLLTTRLPGGAPGFSLLVIISGEFAPLQLGFGFTLNGVGGLFGVNRTMNVDALRAGLKAHTLDSVLFPQNLIANAQQIISDLQTVFPPVPDRYVFGPIAKLAWGTPTLLTLELGIVIELPSPVRLVIMGQLRMVLPDEKAALVVVRMDVLGVIDFEKCELSLDATLYDSRVAMFDISGDMAMRLNWGANPTFVLSVGGLNPRFPLPPQFPMLERLAISLAAGDNPRLRLEAYLALTSNTVQFGAHLDLYVEAKTFAGTFSVSGYLGFDALILFAPFHFIVDLEAGVALKRGGQVLFAIYLNLTLSGPQPWHASGQATFVFIVKLHIPFSVTIGEPADEESLPTVSPMLKLQEALRERRNWTAQLPDAHTHVTLREVEATGELLVHPLGSLSVRQQVVPLNVEISRFGNARPDSSGPFTISGVWLGQQQQKEDRVTEVRDYFARGQFSEMNDEEKLSARAFELFMSGVRIDSAAISHGSAVTRTIEYDEVVMDQQRTVSPQRFTFSPDVLLAWTSGGAAALAAMRDSGTARFAGPKQRITLKDVEFGIAGRDDLKAPKGPHIVTPTGPTYMEAQEASRRTRALGGQVQVVGKHEIVE